MKQSPLHDFHIQMGAKMVEYAGWNMPLMYRSIVEEHVHTRTKCSIFDVSHMGRLRIRGQDAFALLQRLCTRNLDGMEPGVCRYSHMCKEDGGILDDLIVSRFEDEWGIVCNAANREKIVDWIRSQIGRQNVELVDETLETAMVALQGPMALDLAKTLIPLDLSGVKRFRFISGVYMFTRYTIFRSGYTGEDGYEVVVPANTAKLLANRLFSESPDAVIRPAGLGARDTLRLETAMPLYGHELGEDIDPLSAGQAWCVDLEKDFVGAQAMRRLRSEGLRKTLAGLEVEGRRTARQHFAVLHQGRPIGQITSGCLSPTLGKSIALALIAPEHAKVETELAVDFGGKPTPARVVTLPFYKRAK